MVRISSALNGCAPSSCARMRSSLSSCRRCSAEATGQLEAAREELRRELGHEPSLSDLAAANRLARVVSGF